MPRGKNTRKIYGGARKSAKAARKQGRKTQSRKATMTIPELRSSMQRVDAYAHKLIKDRKASPKAQAARFAQEWRAIFGKSLDTKKAEAYLRHAKAMSRNRTRRLRGGAPYLGFQNEVKGAPLDYLTRPGENLPYGQFPTYVSKGFVNPIPAISQSCGIEDGVLPYASTGSNKISGGGIVDLITGAVSAAANRPFIAQNPVTPGMDGQLAWKGQVIGPGPEAWQANHVPYKFSNYTGYPTYSILTRDLATDVKMQSAAATSLTGSR